MAKFGFFSEQLALAMSWRGMSAKTLGKQVGCSYEHVRKMNTSEALPSPILLHKLCELLHWNEKRVWRFVCVDQARKKFGCNFWVCLGKNPKYEEFYILWLFLTKEQQQMAAEFLRFYVSRKQAAERNAA